MGTLTPPTPKGLMLLRDMSDEICGAWLQHAAGDALARPQVQTSSSRGSPLKCILARCRLSTECQSPTGGALKLEYPPCAVASQLWEFIETGLFAYEHYVSTIPNWLLVLCPTALEDENYKDRVRAAQFLLGVSSDRPRPGGAPEPAPTGPVIVDSAGNVPTAPGRPVQYGTTPPTRVESGPHIAMDTREGHTGSSSPRWESWPSTLPTTEGPVAPVVASAEPTSPRE